MLLKGQRLKNNHTNLNKSYETKLVLEPRNNIDKHRKCYGHPYCTLILIKTRQG